MRQLIRKNSEYWNHERSLTALLLYMAFALFIWIPLGEYPLRWWSFFPGDLLFNLITLAGIFSVLTRWKRQLFFICIGISSSLFRIAAFISGAHWILLASYLLTLIFFALLSRLVLKRILQEGAVNFYRIEGSVVVFLTIGVMYAFIYTLLDSILPSSFAATHPSQPLNNLFSQSLYFSFGVMTTVGSADLYPNHPLAKAFTTSQAVIGLLYPVIMIARLVSMEVSHSMQNRKS